MPRKNPKNDTIRVRAHFREGKRIKGYQRRNPNPKNYRFDLFSHGGYNYRIPVQEDVRTDKNEYSVMSDEEFVEFDRKLSRIERDRKK